jgi:hypothetical protein
MTKHISLLAITALFACNTNAQTSADEIKKKYETETIYHTGYGSYVKNGVEQNIGYFGGKMKKEFESSGEGKILFNKYISQRKTSFFTGIGVIAGFVGHSLLVDYDNPGNPDNNLAWASYGAGLALGGVSVYTGIKSYQNLERSIWLRNRDVFQDEEIKKRFETETIYLFNSNHYIKGNQKFKRGFSGRKMRSEFEISPEGMAVFKQYKAQEKKGLILFGAGMATMLGSVLLFDYDDISNNRNYFAGAAYSAGAVMTGFSLYNLVSSQKKLHKSIWIRNRDAIAKQ